MQTITRGIADVAARGSRQKYSTREKDEQKKAEGTGLRKPDELDNSMVWVYDETVKG
jgi:hypothetical protein